MAAIDEWGEVVEGSEDGVFDESALGASPVNLEAPVQSVPSFPKSARNLPPDAVQISKFPKYPGSMGDYRVATAGMGVISAENYNWGPRYDPNVTRIGSISELNAFTGSSGGKTAAAGTGMSVEQRVGIANSVLTGITDIAGGVMGMVTGYQESQVQQQAASQQLQMQMRLLDEQIAASRDTRQRANLEAQRAAASSALSSGDLSQIIAALQASQGTGIPTWVWVVGGVAVLGIGGLLIWKVASK